MAWVWSFSFFFDKHILTQKYKKNNNSNKEQWNNTIKIYNSI